MKKLSLAIIAVAVFGFMAVAPSAVEAKSIVRINGKTFVSETGSLKVSMKRTVKIVNGEVVKTCSLIVNGVAQPCE